MIKLPWLAALGVMVATAQPAAADPLPSGGTVATSQINMPFGAGESGPALSAGLPGLVPAKDPLTGVAILDAGLSDWRNTPMVASVAKASAPEMPAWLLMIGGIGLMAVFMNSRRRRLTRR